MSHTPLMDHEMPAFKDLSGQRFGKMVVLGLHPERSANGGTQWNCRCDCGNEKTIRICNIGHNTNSCGCVRNTQGSHSNKHPLWKRWTQMLDRCDNDQSKDFKNYGGRGIAVCARWRHFPSFLEDLEASFFDGATLERENNNGNYEPSNVKWATAKQQVRNRRSSVYIDTPWGKMNVADAAERMGMPRDRLADRVKKGWPTERLFDPEQSAPLPRGRQRRFPLETF